MMCLIMNIPRVVVALKVSDGPEPILFTAAISKEYVVDADRFSIVTSVILAPDML